MKCNDFKCERECVGHYVFCQEHWHLLTTDIRVQVLRYLQAKARFPKKHHLDLEIATYRGACYLAVLRGDLTELKANELYLERLESIRKER